MSGVKRKHFERNDDDVKQPKKKQKINDIYDDNICVVDHVFNKERKYLFKIKFNNKIKWISYEKIKNKKSYKDYIIKNELNTDYIESNNNDLYNIEKILDHEMNDDGELVFHIKWVGYIETTWEPIRNINYTDIYSQYCNQHNLPIKNWKTNNENMDMSDTDVSDINIDIKNNDSSDSEFTCDTDYDFDTIKTPDMKKQRIICDLCDRNYCKPVIEYYYYQIPYQFNNTNIHIRLNKRDKEYWFCPYCIQIAWNLSNNNNNSNNDGKTKFDISNIDLKKYELFVSCKSIGVFGWKSGQVISHKNGIIKLEMFKRNKIDTINSNKILPHNIVWAIKTKKPNRIAVSNLKIVNINNERNMVNIKRFDTNKWVDISQVFHLKLFTEYLINKWKRDNNKRTKNNSLIMPNVCFPILIS